MYGVRQSNCQTIILFPDPASMKNTLHTEVLTAITSPAGSCAATIRRQDRRLGHFLDRVARQRSLRILLGTILVEMNISWHSIRYEKF